MFRNFSPNRFGTFKNTSAKTVQNYNFITLTFVLIVSSRSKS